MGRRSKKELVVVVCVGVGAKRGRSCGEAARADEGVLASCRELHTREADGATWPRWRRSSRDSRQSRNPLYPEHQQPPPVSPRAEIVRTRGPLSHPLPDTAREARGVEAPSPLRASSPDG